MNLSNVDLLKLQTSFMKGDLTTQGLCAALTPQLQAVYQQIIKALILPLISLDSSKISEQLLDLLAYDLHVDWYDATADFDTKVSLIKNSDLVHSYHGTKYAVQQVAREYFPDAVIEEWFEIIAGNSSTCDQRDGLNLTCDQWDSYGFSCNELDAYGSNLLPYWFRVKTNIVITDIKALNLFYNAIEKTKNVRSHFYGVLIIDGLSCDTLDSYDLTCNQWDALELTCDKYYIYSP